MSNPAFVCTPNRIFEGREFNALIGLMAQAMDATFSGCDLAFLIATRNPATFVPAVFEQARAQNVESHREQAATVARLTAAYEADLTRIAELDGVERLDP